MSTKTYEVTGRPNLPFDVLTDRSVGDIVDADLDKEQEELLISVGALRVVPAKEKPSSSSSASSSSSKSASSDAGKASGQESK